jgi:TatD family-associated radical SAM protein
MSFRGIFHAFSHNASVASRVTELGFHLGIGGVSTFKKAGLLDILHAIPLDRIVLETDSPYLAPHPFRGRRNEPALVGFVADALSHIHGVSPEEVVERTTENFLLAMRIEEKTLPPPVYKIGNRVYIHTIPQSEPGDLADAAMAAVSAATAEPDIDLPRGVAPKNSDAAGDVPVEEVVICGFYEPLEHTDQVTAIAGRLKSLGVRVRVVTGRRGYAALKRDAVGSLSGIVDALTVRMYGATAVQHENTAMTGLGEAAFTSLLEFVEGAVSSGIDTECMFVAPPKLKLDPCRELARNLGTGYKVRKFLSMSK